MGSWMAPTAYLLGIGWVIATPIILGVLLGRWADSATGLSPLLTLVGILLGLAVGMVGGIRMILQFIGRFGNEDREKG